MLPEDRVEGFDEAEANFQGVFEVPLERLVCFVEGGGLLLKLSDLLFQRGIAGDELLVEVERVGLELFVGFDECVALDGVFDGGEQFFADPRFGEEAEDMVSYLTLGLLTWMNAA
ncbi:MAG: hypothetical protein F6J92_33540 [Symploca sp. SIO1A3]|nr:hypothetical protein [Symploca sp. SIO1A3]